MRPGGWHMAPSHLPKKKNWLAIQERTRSQSWGGGVSGGRASLPTRTGSPACLPPPHLRRPQRVQQPLGGEPRAEPHQPAEAPQLPADEIWGW